MFLTMNATYWMPKVLHPLTSDGMMGSLLQLVGCWLLMHGDLGLAFKLISC